MKITKELQLNADSRSHGEIEGYASTWNTLDRHTHIVARGAYAAGLDWFLENNFIGGPGHDWKNPVGKFFEAREDSRGLFVRGRFSNTVGAQDCRTLVVDGVLKKLSVGIEIEESQRISPREVLALWRSEGYTPGTAELKRLDGAKSVLVIQRALLLEVSPVTVPANDEAKITGFKALAGV